jgi:hypothetical protein
MQFLMPIPILTLIPPRTLKSTGSAASSPTSATDSDSTSAPSLRARAREPSARCFLRRA